MKVLDREDFIGMAEKLGWQKDDMKALEKEWK